ncbi:hypothetical protein [Mesomycoplasma ovipneumoniae]|uniref:hypothetical protein n=1 Tax=Mesomycoplasma ovipneumoniae TaxID=29562 RepID=UPI00083E81C6|nr:hypothetical protein [Mesomycoplasma ovipneumoniae]
MKFSIDKEFIEKEVWYELDQWSHPDLIEIWYFFYKSRYDSKNLIVPAPTNVPEADYKQQLAKILIENPYAYFKHTNGERLDPKFNPFHNHQDYINKEIQRLSEEEQVKWIKRLGKSLGTLDGKFQQEWIETEKLQWITSSQELQSYWLDVKMKDLDGRPGNKRKFNSYLKFKKNNENLSWSTELENQSNLLHAFKWAQIGYSDSKIPPMEIDWLVKDSSTALSKILYENRSIYWNIYPGVYEIFSIHEPKSNFNLINSLLNKYWKNYPGMHEDETKRKEALKSFWNDVKSGKMKDPEVEILGFKRYPELKQEVESKKDNLEQTQKFGGSKMKMKM